MFMEIHNVVNTVTYQVFFIQILIIHDNSSSQVDDKRR